MKKIKVRVWAKLPGEEKVRQDIIEVDYDLVDKFSVTGSRSDTGRKIAEAGLRARAFNKWLSIQMEGCGYSEVDESTELTLDLKSAYTNKLNRIEEL